MSENVLAHSGAEGVALERPRAFDAILYGGLLVGLPIALIARWSARKANRQTEVQNEQVENLIRPAKRTKEALH